MTNRPIGDKISLGTKVENPVVTVIIPTYNRKTILLKALNGLFHQTLAKDKYEVIVIDDGSTDNTFAALLELNPPVEMIYTRTERMGPAGARNQGLKIARGKFIVFMDSDIVPCPEFLEAHLKAHTTDDLVGHGPVIHTNDIDNPTEAELKLTDMSRAFFATGNASILKQHLFDAGLFDEDFREYGWEDLELGLRLRKLGLKKIEVPEAKGFHYKPKLSVRDLHKWKQRERERGHTAVIYYRKHPIMKVRLQTMISPFWFGLDRLLSLGGWTEKPSVESYLERVEERGSHMWLRFIVRLITSHSYFEGMREALNSN